MKKSSALPRILAFALVVCMCAAFCVTPVVTSAEATPTTIQVLPTSGTAINVPGDNIPVSVGGGTITYDAETQTVTIDSISAKQLKIGVNAGDPAIDVELVVKGINSFHHTTNQALYTRNLTSLTITGDADAKLDLYAKGTGAIFGSSASLTIDGPIITAETTSHQTINMTSTTNGHVTIRSGDITLICGGSAPVNCGGTFTMYGGSLDMSGGNNFFFNVGGDIIINDGELTMDASKAANAAFYSKKDKISLLGGTITGTGLKLFQFSAAGKTIEIDADAKIDFTATSDLFGTNTSAENLTVADGVVFAEGCDPRVDETLTLRTVVGEITGNAMINATATLNGANMEGVTVGLYDAENALVESAVTNANGKATFTLKDLPVGEYDYTLKQTVLNNGISYAAEIPVTVVVDDAGNVTVTENLVFANTYDAEVGYISVTLADGSVATFTDIAGDETATSYVEGIAFDADTDVVTLNNAVGISRIVFALPADFTVELNGANVISTVADGNGVYSFNSSTPDVDMTIVGGEGDSLTITTSTGDVIDDDNYQLQIRVEGNLTFNGGEYTVIGHNNVVSAAGDITVVDGVLNVKSKSTALQAGNDLVISGGDVTATCFNNSFCTNVTNAITISGGTVNLSASDGTAQYLLFSAAGRYTVNGGELIARGKYLFRVRGVEAQINIGADANIDFEGTSAVILQTNGVEGSYVLNLAEGVAFEEGKELTATNGTTQTAVKTAVAAPVPPVSANATISATVTLNDKADAGCVVELWNAEGKITEAIADEAGVVTFTVSELAAGEYTYILKVVGENGNGYTFAEDVNVTVTVVDNDNVTVAPEAIVLANAYDAEDTSATIEATVTLDGREIGYEEFYLILNGETLAEPLTALVGTDGKASFELPYSAEGTYTYVLSQQAVTLGGVTVDTETTYEITVTVVDNNGALEATVSEGTYTFANTYAVAENEANINVNVTLADKTLNEGDFTFVLKEGDNEIATATNDAAGNVLFNITYNTVGSNVYTYTLTQLDSAIAGVTEDPTEYTITVTVIDNGDGTLTVEVDPANVTFANTYKVPFVEGSIQEIDGELFYVSTEGVPTQMGLFLYEEDGCYYYAGATGRLVVSQTYYAPLVNENCLGMTDGSYYFNEYGQVVGANGGEIVDIDGALYYYEGGKPVYKGLFLYDGVYYYAGTAGQLLFDTSYYTWKVDASVTDLGPATYYFDSNCKLIGASAEGEIVEIDGVEYFFRSGKAVYAGLITVDGTVYYAGTEGKILKNRTYYVSRIDASAATIAAGTYTFGADGAMVGLSAEGEIVEIDGVDYFYRNGKAVYAGLITVDGTVYYAGTNGKILKNRTYYVSRIDASAASYVAGTYTFGADGVLVP